MKIYYAHLLFRWMVLLAGLEMFRIGCLDGTWFEFRNEASGKFFLGLSLLLPAVHALFFFPDEDELRRMNAYGKSETSFIACWPMFIAAAIFFLMGPCTK